MIIEVTDKQVQKMGALAINASKAVGLGFLSFIKSEELTPDDIHIVDGRLHIDYYHGRMVKFHGRKVEEGKWEFADSISPNYESWITTYESYEMLANAARV